MGGRPIRLYNCMTSQLGWVLWWVTRPLHVKIKFAHPLNPVNDQPAGKSVSFYLSVLRLHTDNRVTRTWQLFIILCTALARRDLWLQSWVRPYGTVFAACEDHAATRGKTNLESHVRMVGGLQAAKPDTGRQFGAKVQRVGSDAQNPLHSWTQHSSANLQLQNDDNMYARFN